MISEHLIFWNSNGLSHERLDRLELRYSSPMYDNSNVLAVCCVETKHDPLAQPRTAGTRDLQGFVTYRKPFSSNSGGIAIFLKQTVPARHRADLEKSPHCLIMECQMPGAPGPCLLCVCYRRQAEGAAGWTSLKRSLLAAMTTKLPVIALGDFNAHAKDFGDLRNCSFGIDLVNFCDDQGLTALNPVFCAGRPTRKKAVLDLALVSNEACVNAMEIGGKSGLFSDHASFSLQLSAINIVEEPKSDHERWNVANADWSLFKSLAQARAALSLEHCVSLQNLENKQAAVDAMAQEMEHVFDTCGQEAMGKKRLSSRKRAWYEHDAQLQPLFKSFNSAKRRDFRLQTDESRLGADQSFEEWQTKLRAVKKTFWEKECAKIAGTGQVNWSAFKEIHKPGTFPINSIRGVDGKLPASSADALNSLAKHFAEVCTLPELKRMTPDQVEHRREIDDTISSTAASISAIDNAFSYDEVASAISDFKNPKAAAGPDSIPVIFLKNSPAPMIRLLRFIFSFSWEHGVIPITWKTANVCAIFKHGNTDRSAPANYRPISLTSVICKLLERVILKRLWKLVGHRINRLQFGFRGGCSTLDALLRLQHQIFAAFDKREHLSVCFLDISKAFDRTWHAGLLHKLAKIGVTGNAWRWCRAFLSDRKIRVVHDGQFSDWFSINAGVPQGSVLSPFLFLVYINDVFDVCEKRAEFILYADDIAVIPCLPGKAGDDQLVRVFYRLDCWSKRWRLDFNSKKSKLLCFNNKKRKPRPRPQLLNLEFLEQVKTFDYLGLRWQENGQWHQHHEKVLTAAKRVRYLIGSVISRDNPPLQVVRQLCHALIRSKFSYGMPVWRPNSERAWSKLDVILTDPIRRCLRLPKSTFLQSVLVETNTLSMRLHYELMAIATAQKALRLPPSHSTREIVDEQADAKIRVKKRALLLPQAKVFASQNKVDFEQVKAARLLLVHFLLRQRRDWRNSGKGRFLRHLTNDGFDRRDGCLLLPRYLYHDKPRQAAVRAKLRFDRSNLKDTLARQSIIKVGESTACSWCRYGVEDNVRHMLFSCSAFKVARDSLRARSKLLRLCVKPAYSLRWLLGDVSRVPKRLRLCALSLSVEFLEVIDSVRNL